MVMAAAPLKMNLAVTGREVFLLMVKCPGRVCTGRLTKVRSGMGSPLIIPK